MMPDAAISTMSTEKSMMAVGDIAMDAHKPHLSKVLEASMAYQSSPVKLTLLATVPVKMMGTERPMPDGSIRLSVKALVICAGTDVLVKSKLSLRGTTAMSRISRLPSALMTNLASALISNSPEPNT